MSNDSAGYIDFTISPIDDKGECMDNPNWQYLHFCPLRTLVVEYIVA